MWQSIPNFGSKSWFNFITIVSSIGYTLVGLAVFFNKELQVHPMKLVMYMSFVDAAFCFNLYESYYVCGGFY